MKYNNSIIVLNHDERLQPFFTTLIKTCLRLIVPNGNHTLHIFYNYNFTYQLLIH